METCGERRYAADLVAFPDTDCCRRLGYIRAAAGILDFFTLFFPRHNEREQCRLTFACQILLVCMLGSESCLSRLKSTLPLVLSFCSSSRSLVMAVENVGKWFGGNTREKLTLAGRSAGAYSVHAQVCHEFFMRKGAQKDDAPMFNRLIMYGTVFSFFSLTPSVPLSDFVLLITAYPWRRQGLKRHSHLSEVPLRRPTTVRGASYRLLHSSLPLRARKACSAPIDTRTGTHQQSHGTEDAYLPTSPGWCLLPDRSV